MQRKGRAPGTVRNAYRVLMPILDAAVELRCISANPCGPLRRDDLPRSQRTEMLFLTPGEVARLAAAMPGGPNGPKSRKAASPAGPDAEAAPSPDHTPAPAGNPDPAPGPMFVHFAAQTGMRYGEIAALRMANVDLLHRKITVAASLSVVRGEIIEERPKNGEERTIRLSKSFAATLRAYVEAHAPAGYLFPAPSARDGSAPDGSGRDSSAPWLHTSAYPMFKAAARRAGLNPALRIHDLRRTCASLLIAQNVPPKVIQQHLGHKSFAITMDRYGHLYPEASEQLAEALDRVPDRVSTRPSTRPGHPARHP